MHRKRSNLTKVWEKWDWTCWKICWWFVTRSSDVVERRQRENKGRPDKQLVTMNTERWSSLVTCTTSPPPCCCCTYTHVYRRVAGDPLHSSLPLGPSGVGVGMRGDKDRRIIRHKRDTIAHKLYDTDCWVMIIRELFVLLLDIHTHTTNLDLLI
jgi:hypothetical protein